MIYQRLQQRPAGDSGESPTTQKALTGTPASAQATAKSMRRRVLFQYRNAKAKQVAILGEFTNWQPQAMVSDASGLWKYIVELEPGEYAYFFSVDNRAMRDPSNSRTKMVGQSTLSLVIVSSPAASAAASSHIP